MEFGSLNPCCSGQWPRTYYDDRSDIPEFKVLILVVVDNGLVQKHDRELRSKYPKS